MGRRLNAATSASATGSLRELDSRESDSLHVRLLWDPIDERTTVIVLDRKTGDSFNIEIRPQERALDVFAHPFAYAACHGVSTRARDRLVLA
jgi:hypothetical protein